MRVGEGTLGEQIRQDADDVVAVLALVAVDAGVEVVPTARDLRRDEAALVRVDQCGVRQADLCDGTELLVPEGRACARSGRRSHRRRRGHAALGQGYDRAEAVGGDDVVVVDHFPGLDGVGARVERNEGRGGLGVDGDRVCRRVGHADPAVDGDVGMAADHDPIREFGDGDVGSVRVEGGDLGGQVPVGIVPGGLLAGVEAEAVVDEISLRSVLDQEGATEAGDHAVVVAQPADGRRRAEGAGEGSRVDVEGTPIGRRRTPGTRGRGRGGGGVIGGLGRCGQGQGGETEAERSGERQSRDDRPSSRDGGWPGVRGAPPGSAALPEFAAGKQGRPTAGAVAAEPDAARSGPAATPGHHRPSADAAAPRVHRVRHMRASIAVVETGLPRVY